MGWVKEEEIKILTPKPPTMVVGKERKAGLKRWAVSVAKVRKGV